MAKMRMRHIRPLTIKEETIENIINQYQYGLITRREVDLLLDNNGIRGAWSLNDDSKYLFIGFDYKNQVWIELFK